MLIMKCFIEQTCFRCLQNSLSESVSWSDSERLFCTRSLTTEKAQSLSFVYVHTMVAAPMADGVSIEMYLITEICGTVPV